MKKLTSVVLILMMTFMTLSLGACNAPCETENLDNTNTLQASDETSETLDEISNSIDQIAVSSATLFSTEIIPALNEVYERVDLVVVATYKDDIRMFPATSLGIPHTISAFDVHETVKGSLDGTLVNVMYPGGTITLEEYRNALPDHEVVPKRYADGEADSYISDEEARTTYIEYINPIDGSTSLGFENDAQRYMLFLVYDETHDAYALDLVLRVNDNGQVSYLFNDEWLTPSFYKN